ncbi:TPM domain-containing protein [Janthinobacterium agaricidamnosum]|uniref:TPM domain-containing protein n=1 Tax=Janthinobacterium agaricidamnosum NBRC 102515 = DSM 9628 TaxID=1349767 RepID=W0V7M5_9BURK|nr:TPM domain-containing protein [Janthinobacterium agaricidamnosum]CDG84834.1 conserved hypothetical protein [Janthinobacterium agaricidamnosum NBRC 102515 = DSM 9628]
MTVALSFGQRLGRALKHWLATASAGRKAFPDTTLAAIERAISDGEQLHRAELRLILEHSLGLREAFQGLSNRERARQLFAQYGVWDTEENCGVLIYINLAEHQVDIVADRHVGRRIPAQQWQAICRTMTQGYASDEYHASTLKAIDALNDLLRLHFPSNGPRPNQLPNQPIVL